jgi:hypothetical protein
LNQLEERHSSQKEMSNEKKIKLRFPHKNFNQIKTNQVKNENRNLHTKTTRKTAFDNKFQFRQQTFIFNKLVFGNLLDIIFLYTCTKSRSFETCNHNNKEENIVVSNTGSQIDMTL